MFLALFIMFVTACYITHIALYKRTQQSFSLYPFNVERTLPLRGILALLITQHHLSQALSAGGYKIPILLEFSQWGRLVVGIFFFLSGYGMMVSYMKKGEHYLQNFLSHRLGSILPQFLVVTTLYIIWLVTSDGINVIEYLARITKGGTPLPSSWFVFALILFYLLFYTFARIISSKKKLIVMLWIASVLYTITLKVCGWASYWYLTIFAINVGFTYAFYEEKLRGFFITHRKMIVWATWLTSAFIVLFLFIRIILDLNLSYQTAIYNSPALLEDKVFMEKNSFKFSSILIMAVKILSEACIQTYIMLIPLLVVWLIYVLSYRKTRVLNFLGTISYEIYLLQGVFKRELESIILTEYGWPIYLISVYSLTIIFAFLLHYLMVSKKSCRQKK